MKEPGDNDSDRWLLEHLKTIEILLLAMLLDRDKENQQDVELLLERAVKRVLPERFGR
ncbi:MAG TPA: hypothetical protein VGF86_05395 [Candidatus Tumulicola sp.]|jgi:hypothetical protein